MIIINNKIPNNYLFIFVCFIVFTAFSLNIYSNSDTIIIFISDLFSSLFRRGNDDPDSSDSADITLTDNRTNDNKIPNIIITEPDICKTSDNIPSISCKASLRKYFITWFFSFPLQSKGWMILLLQLYLLFIILNLIQFFIQKKLVIRLKH